MTAFDPKSDLAAVRAQLDATLADARRLGLSPADLKADFTAWEPPQAKPAWRDALKRHLNRPFGRDDSADLNDLGRATSRQQYRDSISIFGPFTGVVIEPLPVWVELARFVVLRGFVGVIRLVDTFLDIKASPTAGQFLTDDVYLSFPSFSVKALGGVQGTLGGTAAQQFAPERIRVDLIATVAPLNGNCAIRVGTTLGGNQIITDTPLVGLTTLNGNYSIDLTGPFPAIAGNATLYVTVTTADTGAGTGTARATIYGRASGPGLLAPLGSGSPCGVDPIGHTRNGVLGTWTLRYQPLNGMSPPVGRLPIFWPTQPEGSPWPELGDWADARYAWGTANDQKHIIVPGDTCARLGIYIPAGGLPYCNAFWSWIAGRLQGYVQADHSPAALKNMRHGWQW